MVRNYVRPPQSSVNHSTTEFPLQHIVSDVGYPRGRSLPRVLWNALGVHSTLCPQARLEVHRFGITGYGKGKERLLERERAIMLGAQVRGCFCLISRQDTYRKGENPGQGRGGVTGRSLQNKKMVSRFYFSCCISASQKQLRELQGVAGANQRKEGSQGRRKENGTSKSRFVTKLEPGSGRSWPQWSQEAVATVG